MTEKPKLKAINASLFAIGCDGKKTPLCDVTLSPFHQSKEHVYASGVVLDSSESVLGIITVEKVPIDDWPQEQVGRPKQTEKHIRVLLMWALHMGRLGRKHGLADNAVADSLNEKKRKLYSEGAKVRNVRVKMAKDLKIDLHNVILLSDLGKGPDAAVLILKPIWNRIDGKSFEVSGKGYLWSDQIKDEYHKLTSGLITIGAKEGTGNFTDAKSSAKGGPIIIASFKPG